MVAGYEISGMIGALIGGWLTDRLFGGRGFRSCVFTAMAGVSILLFCGRWLAIDNSTPCSSAPRASSFTARNASSASPPPISPPSAPPPPVG
jgi:hypothetical protein